MKEKQGEIPLSKSMVENVLRYAVINDKLILDLPSEDTKIFSVQNDNYFYVASKRGMLFQLAAILSLFFIFWVFYLRISKGHCGGYKTMIRKPSKELRHNRIKIVIISSVLAILCLGATIFCYA